MEFTTDEIKEQLAKLGYHSVPLQQLELFKKDLDALVSREQSKDSSFSSSCVESQGAHCSGMMAPSRFEPQHRLVNKPPALNVRSCWTNKENAFPSSAITQQHPHHITKNHSENAVNPLHHDRFRPGPAPSVQFQTKQPHLQPSVNVGESRSFVQRDKLVDFSLYSDSDGLSQLGSDVLDTTTESERQRVAVKRKVLRKQNGESVVVDESVTESEPDDIASLQERLANMPISMSRVRPSSAPSMCASRSRTQEQPCYRLPDDFDKPKALIKPMTCAPHLRNTLRSDPVARYQKYNSGWRAQRTPGEKAHAELRWSVREQLLHKDELCEKRPQKSYVPNKYVVPTDKKRKSLRWQMRHDLARGIVPPSAFD